MADKNLSSLTAATLPFAGTEKFYVVQGGNSRQGTIADAWYGSAAGFYDNATSGFSSSTLQDVIDEIAVVLAAATLADGDKGDLTISGGGTVWTIDNGVVTNAKLANMSTATFKGRTTDGSGDPEDLTATQATALLNAVVGDSGSGGTKGLVPAPAAGDAAAAKFLKADGTWVAPSGTGASTGTNMIAGSGLTGGGTLAADRTFTVGAGTGITVNADDVQIATAYQAIGKQTIWIPASAMSPATTNGPATGQIESTTNKVNIPVLDFDATTAEQAWFNVAFPKGWNEGTVTFQVFWASTATDTDGIAMSLAGISFADNETLDTALGTAVIVTDDAQSNSTELYVTSESSAVTIGGSPAVDELVAFRVQRVVSDGNDDMTEDMRLIGIKLFYTTDAANDA